MSTVENTTRLVVFDDLAIIFAVLVGGVVLAGVQSIVLQALQKANLKNRRSPIKVGE